MSCMSIKMTLLHLSASKAPCLGGRHTTASERKGWDGMEGSRGGLGEAGWVLIYLDSF